MTALKQLVHTLDPSRSVVSSKKHTPHARRGRRYESTSFWIEEERLVRAVGDLGFTEMHGSELQSYPVVLKAWRSTFQPLIDQVYGREEAVRDQPVFRLINDLCRENVTAEDFDSRSLALARLTADGICSVDREGEIEINRDGYMIAAYVDHEYAEAVHRLSRLGRGGLADSIGDQLESRRQFEEENLPRPESLLQMAEFLAKFNEFKDPTFGSDPLGNVQVEWHTYGKGVIVMAFLEAGEIECVVQADAEDGKPELDEWATGTWDHIVEKFGYLVPVR